MNKNVDAEPTMAAANANSSFVRPPDIEGRKITVIPITVTMAAVMLDIDRFISLNYS